MPAVARAAAPALGIPTGAPDSVLSADGFGTDCVYPGVATPILIGNPFNVYVNGFAPPVLGQPVPPHPVSGCAPDLSVLSTGSTSVFIGGLPVARIGDLYGPRNIIISGSSNVFIGG